jgi:NAD(P)H-quinone oxidoreductase subunit 5
MPKTKIQIIALALLYGLFVLAVFVFARMACTGAMTMALFHQDFGNINLNLAVRLDSLSAIILLMASFLGVVIGQYSVRYLDGEPRQNSFFRNLCFTVFAVAGLVTASNLLILFIAWLAMSIGLHNLLLFYPNRTNAIYAARKKFLVSRLGDLLLLIGIGLVYQAFGTFEFQEIFRLSQETLNAGQSILLSWSGFFFVCGAMTKSAQFPFHFWLPETMETPTPVSALMHAGVINAGGFLLIRLSPLIVHASFACLMLAIVGAFTGVYASLIMITQNDIKRKLAYSTISQMGLMMFACGIGAYTFALFHIVAHSFYKAHAFLSTGDLVEESKKISLAIDPKSLWKMTFFVFLGFWLIFFGLYFHEGVHLPEFTYLAVLLLGLSQNSETLRLRTKIGALVPLQVAGALLVGVSVYSIFEKLLHLLTLNDIVRWQGKVDIYSPLFVICITGYLIFAIGFYLANGLVHPKSQKQKRLYVYLWNGGYFGVSTNRLLQLLWLVD